MRKRYLDVSILLIISGIFIITLSLLPVPFTTTKTFEVEKSATEIDESFIVSPRNHQYYTRAFPTGSELMINFEVTSGGNLDVNFWITTEWEYYKWKADETSKSFIYRDRASSFSQKWGPTNNDPLYFVFDNSFSTITSKTVSFRVDRLWIESEKRQVTENSPLMPSEASYIGIAIIFIGIAVVGIGIVFRIDDWMEI